MSSERTKRRRVKEELESVFDLNFLSLQRKIPNVTNTYSNEINVNDEANDKINHNVDSTFGENCFTPVSTFSNVFITYFLIIRLAFTCLLFFIYNLLL